MASQRKKEKKEKKKLNSEEEEDDIKNNFYLLAIKLAKTKVYDRMEDEFLPNNLLVMLKICKESHNRDDSISIYMDFTL